MLCTNSSAKPCPAPRLLMPSSLLQPIPSFLTPSGLPALTMTTAWNVSTTKYASGITNSGLHPSTSIAMPITALMSPGQSTTRTRHLWRTPSAVAKTRYLVNVPSAPKTAFPAAARASCAISASRSWENRGISATLTSSLHLSNPFHLFS
jgi:hypothetical protein